VVRCTSRRRMSLFVRPVNRRRVDAHVARQLGHALAVALVELVEEAQLLERQPNSSHWCTRVASTAASARAHSLIALSGEDLDVFGVAGGYKLHTTLIARHIDTQSARAFVSG